MEKADLTPAELIALRKEALKRFGGQRLLVKDEGPSARAIERSHAFLHELHEKQRDVADCESRRIVVITPRRWGKTTLLLYLAMRALRDHPGVTIPYIGIDRMTAKRIFWKPLKMLDQRWHLNLTFSETALTATAPNGAMVWLIGARDTDDIEKLRGDKYSLVLVDESASFKPHIEAMVEEVVEPALGDLNGQLIVAGTPKDPKGFFFEIATGVRPGWTVFHGTAYDNSKFPAWANSKTYEKEVKKYLGKQAQRLGGYDNAAFRREYLGEFVFSTSSFVYRFDPNVNLYKELPENREWFHILAIDFGFAPDPTAFVVLAFSPHDTCCYVREVFYKQRMLADDIAAKIKELQAKFHGFIKIIGDMGAKQFFEELRIRKGVPIVAADKHDKRSYIEHLNNDFIIGRIKIKEECPLINEIQKLTWTEDGSAEDPRCANHGTDAMLYAWRASRHYAGQMQPKEVDANSHEGQVAWLAEYKAELEDRRRRREEDIFSDYGI